jgi:transaldolase
MNNLLTRFSFIDNNKAQKLCLEAQRYYEANKVKTQVLPASLTSTTEIMELAGVHHITIAPALLQQLATTPASGLTTKSLFDQAATKVYKGKPFIGDEAGYRLAFTRSGNGEGERKLSQAINIFCDMQTEFEALMARA